MLQGVGKYLKEKNPRVKIVAVEPRSSTALPHREPGLHQIQGIGDGFVPAVLDVNLIDMVITVSDEEAIDTTRRLACVERPAGGDVLGGQCGRGAAPG